MEFDTIQAEPVTQATPADGFSKSPTSPTQPQAYSLTEVGKFLNVNESTLRNWEKRFGEFLSNYRNQYNHRLFTDGDVAILERIKYLMESGMFTVEGVKHMLSGKGDIAGVKTGESAQTQAIMTQQEKEAEEEYRQKLLFALNSLGSEIHSLRREVREDLKGSLKAELDHLKLLLFPPEQPKKTPWYRWW
jgi:DNA-binding transcriptional MerR regulator